MPEMNPGQKISHSNPQHRGTIFRNNENAHTFLQGQREGRGARSQCRGEGCTPPLPPVRASSSGPARFEDPGQPCLPGPSPKVPSWLFFCSSASESVLISVPVSFSYSPSLPTPSPCAGNWGTAETDQTLKAEPNTVMGPGSEAVGETHAREEQTEREGQTWSIQEGWEGNRAQVRAGKVPSVACCWPCAGGDSLPGLPPSPPAAPPQAGPSCLPSAGPH